jgi:hypothetical protein
MKKRVFVLLFFIFTVLIGTANAVDFNISPENPVKGNVVTIYGTANPNEDVKIEISFEKVVPVQNGEYVFSVNGVKIPEGKNRFTVTAYGCDDLKVSVKILFNLVWVTLSSEASNGVATVSQSNVPPGTYDVVIHGKSSQTSVKLKITATGYIKADKNGKFSYSYDTSSIPPGEFTISVGGITKTVTLAEKSASPSSGSSGGSAGGGSSAPTPTPTQMPMPTPTHTPTPTPTPTPTITTPKRTPIPTPTPHTPVKNPPVSPTPTLTPENTPTTAGSSTQQVNETNKANKNQKPSLSIQIHGFELTTAVVCLILAIIANRRFR